MPQGELYTVERVDAVGFTEVVIHPNVIGGSALEAWYKSGELPEALTDDTENESTGV